jgi:hypothetical protein
LRKLFFYSFLASTLLFACGEKSKQVNEEVLAEYKANKLLKSDIPEDILSKFREGDSTNLLKSFIDTWLENQVMLEVAEKSLSEEEKDKEKLIEDYRTSLLIYEYQQKLMKKMLDTAVTESEIDTFYKNNLNTFLLRKNIVKIRYVKIDKSNNSAKKVKQLIQSNDVGSVEKLRELAEKDADNFYLDSNWLYLNEITKEIPLDENYNQQRFLSNNKFIQLEENGTLYFLYILDFKIKNAISPIEFEREKIKDIILYKRKLDVLKQNQKTLFEQAKQSGEIKYYLNK